MTQVESLLIATAFIVYYTFFTLSTIFEKFVVFACQAGISAYYNFRKFKILNYLFFKLRLLIVQNESESHAIGVVGVVVVVAVAVGVVHISEVRRTRQHIQSVTRLLFLLL